MVLISADADDKTKKKKQLKTSAIAFNAIVRIYLKQLLPAIYRFLHIKLVTTSKLKPETSSNKCLMHFTRVCLCRYAKCTSIGMKPKWVLSDEEREEKYVSRRKRFRINRNKFLAKEKKILIEDIAHALYQSRATYPLTFPSPSILFANTPNPLSDNTNVQSPNNEKPPNPSANFLIVPIQRLVLFARMLKDFDLFSPNRLNIKDLDLVKCLQETYATLLRKYMNWRYGIEQPKNIYPKLLFEDFRKTNTITKDIY